MHDQRTVHNAEFELFTCVPAGFQDSALLQVLPDGCVLRRAHILVAGEYRLLLFHQCELSGGEEGALVALAAPPDSPNLSEQHFANITAVREMALTATGQLQQGWEPALPPLSMLPLRAALLLEAPDLPLPCAEPADELETGDLAWNLGTGADTDKEDGVWATPVYDEIEQPAEADWSSEDESEELGFQLIDDAEVRPLIPSAAVNWIFDQCSFQLGSCCAVHHDQAHASTPLTGLDRPWPSKYKKGQKDSEVSHRAAGGGSLYRR